MSAISAGRSISSALSGAITVCTVMNKTYHLKAVLIGGQTIRQTPTFEILRPCEKNWDLMQGDTRRRFCGDCQKHVTNLSDIKGMIKLRVYQA